MKTKTKTKNIEGENETKKQDIRKRLNKNEKTAKQKCNLVLIQCASVQKLCAYWLPSLLLFLHV